MQNLIAWQPHNPCFFVSLTLSIILHCIIDYFQAKGKSFDYIFGDLTDTPITTKKPCEDCWIFLSTILELGMSVLKPLTGKYLTHCNGVNVPQSITAYENVLAKICGGKVFYSKTKCYVKSFFETWVFYQLSRRDWLLVWNGNFWMII